MIAVVAGIKNAFPVADDELSPRERLDLHGVEYHRVERPFQSLGQSAVLSVHCREGESEQQSERVFLHVRESFGIQIYETFR